jgi:hypothetical protein
MGVLLAQDRSQWWATERDGTCCFTCGESLNGPFATVFWKGCGGWLELHPNCATDLGTHLIADAREALPGTGDRLWVARAARVISSSPSLPPPSRAPAHHSTPPQPTPSTRGTAKVSCSPPASSWRVRRLRHCGRMASRLKQSMARRRQTSVERSCSGCTPARRR